MENKLWYRLQIVIGKEEILLDGQVVALLEQIAATHSLRGAARTLDMPYSRAWKLLKNVESGLSVTLFETGIGGEKGGYSVPTAACRRLIASYHDFCEVVESAANAAFEKCFGDLGG
jgi:molybdate transport system regulatory protein